MFEITRWEVQPLAWFGIENITINLDTILHTWLAMSVLFVLILMGRRFLNGKSNVPSFMMEQAVQSITNLCIESFGFFKYEYFAFVSSIFFFTLACNLIALLPFIEEPTTDPHTTFALGITSFCYVQYQKMRVHGLGGYLKEFFQPIFIMLPLNVIGELAKVISMSFRLFGNILGGAIVMLIAVHAIEVYRVWVMGFVAITLGLYALVRLTLDLERLPMLRKICNSFLLVVFLIPSMQVFFGVFEGFIQAFVIMMLTITYLAVGTIDHEVGEETIG